MTSAEARPAAEPPRQARAIASRRRIVEAAVLERFRLRMVDWVCEAAGLEPRSPAARLMLRTAGDALDQLSLRWLRQGRPFDIERLVEAMVHVVTGSLSAARSLDPSLDVTAGIALLAEPGAGSPA